MAADAKRTPGPIGFALLTAVVAISIVAVLATTMLVTLSGDHDQARIERTADILQRLVAAIDTTRLSSGQSFRAQVTKHPGRLSHLYTKILSSDRSCTTGTYTGSQISGWRGPYYMVPISTAGHRITPGFFADDSIQYVISGPNVDMAIQMQNVALADAKALELLIEKKSDGSGPIVTYSPTDGSSPVVVKYHTAVSGC